MPFVTFCPIKKHRYLCLCYNFFLTPFLSTMTNLETTDIANSISLSIDLDKDFCRCCHSEGSFVSLDSTVVNDLGEEEIIKDLLKEFLDLYLPKVDCIYKDVTYKICTMCIWKLREAVTFKTQVLNYETKFKGFIQNLELLEEVHNLPFEDDNHVEDEIEEENNYVKFRDDDEHSVDAEVLDECLSDDDCAIVPMDINIDDVEVPPVLEEIPMVVKKVRKRKKTEKKLAPVVNKEPKEKKKPVFLTEMDRLQWKLPPLYRLDTLREGRRGPEVEHYQTDDDGTMKCNRCNTSTKIYKDMIKHITVVHNDEISDYLPLNGFLYLYKPLPAGRFKCNICDAKLHSKSYAMIHIQQVHLKLSRYYCECCVERFRKEKRLLKHLFEVHQIDKRICCSACEKKFYCKIRLKDHIECYHLMTTYSCSLCDFTCIGKGRLMIHYVTHKGPKELLVCSDCGYKNDNKEKYKRHLINHKLTKDFKCQYCSKTFKRRNTLRQHEMIHTGEKNKECKVCGERFVQKASLNYHMGKHHPDVPF